LIAAICYIGARAPLYRIGFEAVVGADHTAFLAAA
jgi:hypothetical protein